MKKSLSILLLVSGLFAAPVYSQDYYVCNNGSDTNTGLSQSEPWATFDYAMTRFKTINAGDSVLFCRGGQFTSSHPWINNFNCRADSPCTIGDYGEGELPLIVGNANGVINFQDGSNADHDEGYIVKNLSLKGQGAGYGIFLYNDIDYLTIDGVTIDGFNIGIYSAKANTPNEGANQKNEFITLKNSVIKNNGGQGWLGGCNDCSIEKSKFINNGFFRLNLNHNIYVTDSERLTITDNELYQSTMIDGKCTGVSLVAHGVIDDLVIKNNWVHEDLGAAVPNCWGISVDPAYAVEESFSHVFIANNRVENVGNTSIGCASCVDSWIVDNTIIHAQDFGATAIKVPVRAEDLVKSGNILIGGNDITLIDPNNRGKNGIVTGYMTDFYEIGNVIH